MPFLHRHPLLRATALAAALAAGAAGAFAQSAAGLGHGSARIERAAPGRTLTDASRAAPAAVVAAHLKARGRAQADLDALRTARSSPGKGGVTHVRLEQQVAGLTVHGAYAKAAVDAQGRLVHVIDNLAKVAPLQAARIDATAALQVAMATVHPGRAVDTRVAGRSGNSTLFAAGRFFHRAPEVTAVAVPLSNGVLQRGFLVETWTRAGNQLHHTLVGGDGRVLDVEARTASDSYKVFLLDPGKDDQVTAYGPGTAGNAESPAGWLAGNQTTLAISGNNAFAYLDRNDDNRADGGGVGAGSDFLATIVADAEPTVGDNQAVAVQNLFWLNNRIHDILYRHGFTEAAANFQANNFGKGGRGNDPVQAEAQDGGGTDNANFATPSDGRAPRMQMYLWNGRPTHQVLAAGGPYEAAGSAFGPPVTPAGFGGTLRTTLPANGCTAVAALPANTVAVIDRGDCEFATKVLNAQNAGATGVVIANNNQDNPTEVFGPASGVDGPSVTIPSVLVGYTSGVALKGLAGTTATVVKVDPAPPMVDAALDSDIVYHEYCHGLTWRMIGRMSGPLAGAIGEGMSDVCALMINSDPLANPPDDVVAEYSASDPRGIRSRPYTGHPRTYGDIGTVPGSPQVHFDGEIYAAIIWDLMGRFAREQSISYEDGWRNQLFGYLVDGMNYTPAKPAYEDMRDGILAAVAAGNRRADCAKVWDAFADRGVGILAKGTVRGSRAVVRADTSRPPSCN